ncbi:MULTISPECIES: GntR family transcriptional regulator [Streptomyces]|uniref:GntR family transcriptional regulator n=2 Tax=Streptomyces TaxID=1883 RepID=A0ABU4KIH1_9ACTN|nr:GntR family transcriptional regulator [Streptomyces roseolus]MDX2297592.1 GntR family transcriptional regulator [Streptomyces roseolus]
MTHAVPSLRHTIADDLRTQIATGRLKADERLPSEPQLAAHYKVSTATLRLALALLQAEGLIEKIHGKGNFVRPPLRRITYAGGGRTPFDPALQVSICTTNLRARGHLRALLRVSSNSPLTEFLCVTHEGKSPHSLARIYVPRDLAPTIQLNSSPRPREAEPTATKVRETVTARLPTQEEATTLRISSTLAVLAITSVATDATGRVVEAALLVLPGDRADAVFTAHPTTEERETEG